MIKENYYSSEYYKQGEIYFLKISTVLHSVASLGELFILSVCES